MSVPPAKIRDRTGDGTTSTGTSAVMKLLVPQPRAQIRRAILEFAARRGLRLGESGWVFKQLWLSADDWPGDAGISVSFAAQTNGGAGDRQTLVTLTFAYDVAVTVTAHFLHQFLESPTAYQRQTVLECPKCSQSVTRARAVFCALCGTRLATEATAPERPTYTVDVTAAMKKRG